MSVISAHLSVNIVSVHFKILMDGKSFKMDCYHNGRITKKEIYILCKNVTKMVSSSPSGH